MFVWLFGDNLPFIDAVYHHDAYPHLKFLETPVLWDWYGLKKFFSTLVDSHELDSLTQKNIIDIDVYMRSYVQTTDFLLFFYRTSCLLSLGADTLIQ